MLLFSFCTYIIIHLLYGLLCLLMLVSEMSLTVFRQGSGSACRSMYGGFVEWTVGSRDDGTDSVAQQIATEHHWPDMHVLILVVHYCSYCLFAWNPFTLNILSLLSLYCEAGDYKILAVFYRSVFLWFCVLFVDKSYMWGFVKYGELLIWTGECWQEAHGQHRGDADKCRDKQAAAVSCRSHRTRCNVKHERCRLEQKLWPICRTDNEGMWYSLSAEIVSINIGIVS